MSPPSEPRLLTSAFESPTFGEDSSFHVEQPVGSMSISPCGRDVVLASKEGLHIIDLDSPYSLPRYLPHHTPWEVADVQWSPFAARDYWVVSTSNQKALVWNLAMNTGQNSVEYVLHAHSRAITDINFSAHYPDVLATCAVDSFVHCWDLRIPSRPVISFSDWFAGATQVKWNRQDSNVIASSHDKYLRIWDRRKGAHPIKSIEAHDTKIYGVDWNRVRRDALVTCSLDKTIKFWDYTAEGDSPEKLIKTPFPVWRARNTPFGWGVLAMPQRGNSDLHLYSRKAGEGTASGSGLPLVHSFPGHKGQVKEFLWRPRGGTLDGIDYREFQLVSWGTDRELRLHRVDPEILKGVGYEKGKSFISTLNITRKGAVYKTFRDENVELDLDESTTPLASGMGAPHFAAFGNVGAMNTISTPYTRTWTQGGYIDSRIGMQGRSKFQADTNPIAWMRGVKISGWDIETLGDEITHVGEKFTKVAFESVDIRRRQATISLHGPWGTDGASLFLKVDMKFPNDYPRTAVPAFTVQKTNAVTGQFSAKLVADLRKIAKTYLSRKRGCLEGVVRYLLGESSLEESIAWVQNETAETIKSPINGALAGDESSDEDEVGLSQSQELGMSSELLRPVNANVMVPVAKACGALWGPNGCLVCFFPPKKDKTAAVLDSLGFNDMARLSRGDKVFEGFGRLQTNSPGPRNAGTLASTTDDGASEYSDDSDADTSSSSDSSDILSGLPTRFPAPQTWRSGGSWGFYKPRSTDNSQRSTLGGVTVKSSEASYSIISIHDLSNILPARRELASRYRICGKPADICAYNAAVALDAGFYDLSQVWGLVKMILQYHTFRVPNSELEYPERRRNSHFSRNISAVGLNRDGHNDEKRQKYSTTESLNWDSHPFGARWFIPALFEYFERAGDIQMIAMLSCVFHQADTVGGSLRRRQRREGATSRRLSQSTFSLDFSSKNSTAQSKSQMGTPLGSMPKEMQALSIAFSSGHSSSDQPRVDSAAVSYSTGTTPPLASRLTASIPATSRKTHSHNVSIAASPEQSSQPKSSSGFGSVLASSLSRSFTFGPSSASPPTAVPNKKKQSPSGSFNAASASAWLSRGIAAKPATPIPDNLTISATQSAYMSDAGSQQAQRSTNGVSGVRITFKNQGMFGNSGNGNTHLLDSQRHKLYRAYCLAYAQLLSAWGLLVQQSEIIKIGSSINGGAVESPYGRWNQDSSRTSFSVHASDRHGSQQSRGAQDELGLSVQRHCSSCGHPLQILIFSSLAAEWKSQRQLPTNSAPVLCENCHSIYPQPVKIPCVICGEVVDGKLIPCLGCGHVTCDKCHRAWFSSSQQAFRQEASGSAEAQRDVSAPQPCPSGCGCVCSELSAVKVTIPLSVSAPEPPLAGTPASAGHDPLRRQRSPQDKSRTRRGVSEGSGGSGGSGNAVDRAAMGADVEPWHLSSFASFARGLGAGSSGGFGQADDQKNSSHRNSKRSRQTPLRHMQRG